VEEPGTTTGRKSGTGLLRNTIWKIRKLQFSPYLPKVLQPEDFAIRFSQKKNRTEYVIILSNVLTIDDFLINVFIVHKL
jgi:hypothetical protein